MQNAYISIFFDVQIREGVFKCTITFKVKHFREVKNHSTKKKFLGCFLRSQAIFLAHLVYQPKSLYNHALSVVIGDLVVGIVGVVICAHLTLAQG